MEFERHKIPLADSLVAELIAFWEGVFETSYSNFRALLGGSESAHNSDTVYSCREAGRLVATCHLTVPVKVPESGGLGEVGTAVDFRRKGIAFELCKLARNDFLDAGGEAVFLGTGNPAAVGLYERLGWRRIPGSHVLVNTAGGRPAERFMADYFSAGAGTSIARGSCADRIPMIPLLVYPHESPVLDANFGFHSIRHGVQLSCMGLYPQYETLAADGGGAWFAARTRGGRTVGLATARIDTQNHACIDAFAHDGFKNVWPDLVAAARQWSAATGAIACSALVCGEDREKLRRFGELGFRAAGAGQAFAVGGREVASIRMQTTLEDI